MTLRAIYAHQEELANRAQGLILKDERVMTMLGLNYTNENSISSISFHPPHQHSQSSSRVDGHMETYTSTLFRIIGVNGEEGVARLVANEDSAVGINKVQIDHLSVKIGGDIINLSDYKSSTEVSNEV